MNIKAIKTSIFKENQDLMAFIVEFLPTTLPEKSVVVVTSKIVALSEGRTAIAETEEEREALIRSESQWAMKTKYVWLTIKDGLVMASAGIDSSNANGKIVLLPKNSFDAAETIRNFLRAQYGVKELGVLITDSRLFPLRNGVVGVALGYAGIKAIVSYKGTKDIFGREFVFERTDVADALATAAVLEMGEGAEQQPLALITEANVHFVDITDRNELVIDIKEDLYQPLFEKARDIEL